MKFDAFIGGSYESRAITADQERTVNWYPETLQSPGAPSQRVLYPTPGVEVIASITANSPGRAHFSMGGREFAVLGPTFYEFGGGGNVLTSEIAYGTAFLQGPLVNGLTPNTSQPATINSNSDGGDQLFITAGGNGYIYDLSAAPSVGVSFITALEQKAHFGGYLDGYFLALDTDASTLYVSELYDGSTWNTGTQFALRSLGQDKWKAMKVAGRAVWLLGEQTSEVWYNTGDRFPLSPMANQLIPHGIAAPWSAATIGNDIFWLAFTREGRLSVVRASGLTPEVISTYPLDVKMQEYLSKNTAIADAYVDSGHAFYLLNFDNDDITWCFDATTGLWHERGTWYPDLNAFKAWRPRFHAYAFGEHRMLDWSNGNLYRISSDLTRDVDGKMIRRVRKAPGIQRENQRVFYHEFELDLEPGVGVQPGHVGFRMHAAISTVGGVVSVGGTPIPDVIVTITVDGNDYGETTTDEDGAYEFEGIPDGTVIVAVSGEDPATGDPICGDNTDTATGPTAGVLTDPSYLPLNIAAGPCSFEISYVVDINGHGPESTSAYGGGNGLITLTPTVNGGTGPYTYHWRVWDEHTSYLGPRYVDTDEISTQPVSILGVVAVCFGQVRLTVTDATMTVVSVGPETADWLWDCI